MTKEKKDKAQKPDKNEEVLDSQAQLDSFLKNNKEFHYNFEKEVEAYKVSSGSLTLDIDLEGGLGSGVHKFSGSSEGGKTSCALSLMNNFLLSDEPKRKGFHIKAEGRLDEKVRRRSGIKFVFTAEEWVDGTCFVFETNVYETAVGAIRDLVKNNLQKNKYFFIIDSTDGLIPKGDLDKNFEDANKVAGGAVISSKFLQTMSLALNKGGHICIFIGQVRSKPKINPYEKSDPQLTNSSGGNAQQHYPNFILEFQQKHKGSLILDAKGETIGHYCKLIIRKSTNDKTFKEVIYPIKHGRIGGTSVWLELEIAECLIMFEFLSKKGAWYLVKTDLIKELSDISIIIPDTFHGIDNVRKYLEENQDVTKFLYKKFKETLTPP